ncbi:hypothetical protein [Hyalangium versicolor]|uniref:hypothetical protein n=1 Tax=Hyalangium versicolor TaxID=2861190 RepID=UPI001CCB4064|nr:hypothetical protein [Hyalangium versicolor]
MKRRMPGSPWFGVMALVAGALTGTGCNSEDTVENTTAAVSQAVETTSDATDAVDVSSLLHGLHGLRPEAVEGFHCDASPDITYVEVCGQSLPATVHLEWTDCAAPERPGGGGGIGGGGGGGGGGDGRGHGGPGGAGGEALASAASPEKGGFCGAHSGPSSGTVDTTYSYSSGGDCANALTRNQTVTFQITRTAEDGSVSTVQGTSTSSALLVAEGPPQQKETKADVTRTTKDAEGAVVKSVHLTGSMSVAFSADTPPVRTINGSYTQEYLDGTSGTVTLQDVVRQPRNVCPWPTSGTLTQTSSDGTSHALAFGPDCGAATLDGTAVDLPAQPARGKGKR